MVPLSRRTFCRTAAASVALALATGLRATPAGAESCTGGPIRGTFLQLLTADKRLTTAQWAERFARCRRFNIDAIYLQWLAIDGVSFVNDDASAPDHTLGRILAAAETEGIALHVGLLADPGHDPAGEPAAAFAARLAARRHRTHRLAEQVRPHLRNRAFAGWYLPEEIHDAGWMTGAHRDIAADHLVRATRDLLALMPDATVSVSTFVTGKSSVADFTDFWLRVWLQVPLTVMFQDGRGVRPLPEAKLLAYMQGLAQGAHALDRSWAIIIELFKQLSGPPVDDRPFSARPASIGRLAQQIRMAQRFPDAALVGFTVPDYLLSPTGEPSSLGRAYLARYCR